MFQLFGVYCRGTSSKGCILRGPSKTPLTDLLVRVLYPHKGDRDSSQLALSGKGDLALTPQ